jgi:LmbE family N-acetylglucosaminyl deacetylase
MQSEQGSGTNSAQTEAWCDRSTRRTGREAAPQFGRLTAEHIFLSPHFDDAALSCGGLISQLVRQGRSAAVITVFAGDPGGSPPSAFARHLLADWGLGAAAVHRRAAEDAAASAVLGLSRLERWSFPEAPFRRSRDGSALYASYASLKESVAVEDRTLIDDIVIETRNLFRGGSQPILYIPLSLGGHVDHRLLFEAGQRLRCEGCDVLFYEEWPYGEAYELLTPKVGWMSYAVAFSDLKTKVDACSCYRSQIKLLGGSVGRLRRRLDEQARRVGGEELQERYWRVSPDLAARLTSLDVAAPDRCPLVPLEAPLNRPDFTIGSSRLTLAAVLPPGTGDCLCIGPGSASLRGIVERRGYRWRAIDSTGGQAGHPSGSATGVDGPVATGKLAALVLWRLPDGVRHLELLAQSPAAILEQGGVICGRLVTRPSEGGDSPTGLQPFREARRLRDLGLVDIRILVPRTLPVLAMRLLGFISRHVRRIPAMNDRQTRRVPNEASSPHSGRPSRELMFAARRP